jgi:predicted signal transduction protein with EAL and GGDEF domain
LPQANGGRVPAFDEDQAPGPMRGADTVARSAATTSPSCCLRATVSIGAADFPDAAKEGEVLRKHADAAMYAAKAAGGNGYRFWLKPQARLES